MTETPLTHGFRPDSVLTTCCDRPWTSLSEGERPAPIEDELRIHAAARVLMSWWTLGTDIEPGTPADDTDPALVRLT